MNIYSREGLGEFGRAKTQGRSSWWVQSVEFAGSCPPSEVATHFWTLEASLDLLDCGNEAAVVWRVWTLWNAGKKPPKLALKLAHPWSFGDLDGMENVCMGASKWVHRDREQEDSRSGLSLVRKNIEKW